MRKAKPAEAKVNTTAPDSRLLKGCHGFLQGYNAQTAVSREQIILATDVVLDANDKE